MSTSVTLRLVKKERIYGSVLKKGSCLKNTCEFHAEELGQIGQSLFSRDFRSSGKGEGLLIGYSLDY